MEDVVDEWRVGKNLSANQSGCKWEGLYMDLRIPKREGELGAKVGQISFTWCKSGGNKISDSCQGLKIAALNELSKNN